MSNFESKVERVRAVRYGGNNARALLSWSGGRWLEEGDIQIPTLEGPVTVSVGDWVVRNRDTGEMYAMHDDEFNAKFGPSTEGVGYVTKDVPVEPTPIVQPVHHYDEEWRPNFEPAESGDKGVPMALDVDPRERYRK